MKKNVIFLFIFVISFFHISCEDNDDNLVPSNLQIQDFVWKGMNLYYLWQNDVPDLADDRFANQNELNTYLNNFNNPATLFNNLRINNNIDRFSVIFDDYDVLEGLLSGNTLNNGVEFGIRLKPGSTSQVFGWVRYIIPGSDAASKDIQRGDIFYAVNGTTLTTENVNSLLSLNNYTLNLANFDGGNITPNGESVSLTKTELAENPILLNSVITENQKKIGYIVYNGFFAAYDDELNSVFGNFKSLAVTDLVLDLRYNSGGSVNSATKLASMITGQFSGEVFAKQQWNSKAQAFYESNSPTSLINRFVSGLNSLNLSKVYILTTPSSASASELVINCLKPYIEVIQIGDVTAGKNVGSITLYDSPTFRKENLNPNHKYAMQPIVLKIVNNNNFGDYASGISPDIPLQENLGDLNTLGNTGELLLNAAINQIIASGKLMPQSLSAAKRDIVDSKSMLPMKTEMYVEIK